MDPEAYRTTFIIFISLVFTVSSALLLLRMSSGWNSHLKQMLWCLILPLVGLSLIILGLVLIFLFEKFNLGIVLFILGAHAKGIFFIGWGLYKKPKETWDWVGPFFACRLLDFAAVLIVICLAVITSLFSVRAGFLAVLVFPLIGIALTVLFRKISAIKLPQTWYGLTSFGFCFFIAASVATKMTWNVLCLHEKVCSYP
jgi:hypothetical protein